MASLSLLCLVTILILLSSTATATATAKFNIPLSPFTSHHSSAGNTHQFISNLATSSLARAHHLKHTKGKANPTTVDQYTSSLLKTELFPHSYGGYSIDLSFGTPPQTTSFVMDTGSSLVWFPCTSRYLCSSCEFSGVDPENIAKFIPRNSSSTKILGCKNPKCSWLFGPDVSCPKCQVTNPNCTQSCPAYGLQYGLGSTTGFLLLETLDFPEKRFTDFIVGCSILSDRQPSGIAGFGQGPESLPKQLGLKKFSYCLVSRKFDDTKVSGDMILETGSGQKTHNVSFTPFLKNPYLSNAAFQEYYYVLLRKISVGGSDVKIPYKYLVPGSDGNGGTIVDSGTTFSFMEKPMFELVSQAFIKQMGMLNYSRSTRAEDLTGLSPCFNLTGHESIDAPELVFQFKGGARMELPLSNYFVIAGQGQAACLTIMSDMSQGESVGPAMILGNFQQQNYYIEYDLAHKKFGFKRQMCTRK
ncbi:hypothetical protein ACFE04_002218 [Oxalis oulophora]